MTRIALAVFLTIGIIPALAQPIVADIGISVSIEPGGVMPPGTEGVVHITITNHGPDTGAGTFRWVQTDYGAGLSYPPLVFLGLTAGACTMFTFGQPLPGDFFGIQVAREIPPGESRICSYGFRVLDTNQLMQVARWDVLALDGLFLLDDPNLANNEDEVLLIFSPFANARPVPALSWLGLLMLILLVGLAFFYRDFRVYNSSQDCRKYGQPLFRKPKARTATVSFHLEVMPLAENTHRDGVSACHCQDSLIASAGGSRNRQ